MVSYSFETDDGEEVERQFPMGKCPEEITLDDGRTARRVFKSPNISLFSNGHVSGASAARLNADMKKRQERAGKRMKDNWESVKSK